MIKKRNISNSEILLKIDLNEAFNKQLYDKNSNQINPIYFELEATYRYLLELVIANNSEVVYCEKKFEKEDIKPVLEEEFDEYQKVSNFKYFYIRNDLHIEYLSMEELNFLMDIYKKQDLKYDENCKKFILSTLKKVITNRDVPENNFVFYGPLDIKYAAKATDLVLGVKFDYFPDNSKNEEEKYKELLLKRSCASLLLENLDIDTSMKLDYSVKIIEYNDINIKKKSSRII